MNGLSAPAGDPARRGRASRVRCHDEVMDLALFAGLLVGAVFGVVAGYALATSRQGALIARARAAEEKLAYLKVDSRSFDAARAASLAGAP